MARRSRAFMASEQVSELYCDEVLAGDGSILQVDRVLSVSALTETEAAAVYARVYNQTLPEVDPHGG